MLISYRVLILPKLLSELNKESFNPRYFIPIGRVGNGMIFRFPALAIRVRDEEGFEGTNSLIFYWLFEPHYRNKQATAKLKGNSIV